ncbi:MAG: proprotein convertase P-domain-containing protein, partial [Deltaproteobacteria bacterium]|nr:proprotein convertase P-domain-containing protein [Deltaproteobacteria bacterium]
ATTFATGEDTDVDSDGVITCLDCDDTDAANFPGNAEVCDDQDNDCDATTFATGEDTDVDSDGVITCLDCDDTDAANFPGNAEICDDQDNDCDATTFATGEDTDVDSDGVITCLDCDDGDLANFPGNTEICDGQDNDCDGNLSTDEIDDDTDGQTECDGDCDDADPLNYAGNSESCDGQDNDCNGAVDDDLLSVLPGGGAGLLVDGITPVEVELFVAEDGLITDLNVQFSVDHNYVQDISAVIVSPAGTSVLLTSDNGGAGNDYSGTVFDDEATTPVTSGSAPFAGSYQPEALLSAFDGESAGGVWTFIVDDIYAPLDDGTLQAWALELTTDGDADVDLDGALACADCDDDDSANFPANPEVCDGGDNDCDGDADNGADFIPVLLGGGGGTAIPDDDPVGIAVTAVSTETEPITDLDLLLDVTHTFVGDLEITLTSPLGTSVLLMDDVGGADDDLVGTLLDDEAASSVSGGAGPFTGRWSPQSPLSAFDGEVPTGTWTLTVVDDATFDTGTLDGWELHFGSSTVGSGNSCAALSCNGILQGQGTPADGIYWIDPLSSGTPYEAWCDMTTEGGGWTLTMTSSDDGFDTYTWADRLLMSTDTTLVGTVDDTDFDYKSAAQHDLGFTDLLFVHQPSGVTAEYEAVSDTSLDLGLFIDSVPSPNCDYALAGNGYPQTGGTLTQTGGLCDTDLYFNLGDHDVSLATCGSFSGSYNNGTYGPVWSWGNNDGCPFDDPSSVGLGPSFPCAQCPAAGTTTEYSNNGFGGATGLNTGASGTGANHLQVYVR